MKLPLTTARLGLVVAGVLGTAGAVAVASAATNDGSNDPTSFQPASSDDGPGDISGNCDEAEHAGDPECAGVTVTDPTNPTSPTTPTTPTVPTTMPTGGNSPATGAGSVPTAGGTVTYSNSGGSLTLVSAVPANGWAVEVEQGSGREIELDFRSGGQRVQVNIELEDGQVRERVRLRDDADDSDVRIEDGAVQGDDDNSGSGSGHGSDDNSGSGSGSDDTSGSGSSGHGSDDSGSDDSGSGGHGSDD